MQLLILMVIFTLKGVDTKGELVITSIGYEPKIVRAN